MAPNPPQPAPADAAPDTFSAARAFVHVQAIAREPHPIGSPADAIVRAYITNQLWSLGLRTESQGFVAGARAGGAHGVNLMARLPGLANADPGHKTPALALVCHHDSVPTGPGAADDGSGVATLLETARALKSGPPLRNDVLFLFTDGEEAGLDGAQAFVGAHPWMREVGFVLNFEARGVNGPVFMFETGKGNGRAIAEFAKAAPRPVANSLMYEIYRNMPNDTDLTVFKHAGVAGLNFGFIGDPKRYHSPTDDPAHLDRGSLQHDGSYALSLARQFGNIDLNGIQTSDAVYFDLLGRTLVHYPAAWAVPMAGAGVLLFLVVAWRKVRSAQASLGHIVLAWVVAGVNLALVWAFFRYDLHWLNKAWKTAPAWWGAFLETPYFVASMGVTICLNSVLYLLLRKRIAPASFALGGLFSWVLLALGTAIMAPGASYMTLLPLVFGVVGVAMSRKPADGAPALGLPVLLFAALPAALFLFPFVQGAFVALGPWVMLVPAMVLTLGLGAITLQMEALAASWGWFVPFAALCVSAGAVAWAAYA